MATIGSGDFTYEVVDDWAKLPDGWTIGQAEPACDSQDRVYVFNRSDHPLMVFDREGNFLGEWGKEYLTDAHGIYISGEDLIYLPVRESHAIVKCTLDGKPLLTMGIWDTPSDTGGARPDGTMWKAAGPFNRCTDIALAPNGDLYVSDGYANSRVHKFSPDGNLLHSWGRPRQARPRGVSHPPRHLGALGWPGHGVRPGEQPHPALHRRRRVPGNVDRPGAALRHLRGLRRHSVRRGAGRLYDHPEHGRRGTGENGHRRRRRTRGLGRFPTATCTSATTRRAGDW